MLTAATVFLAGCDSLLDLSPQQSIEEETALSTSQNVEAALVGAYDMMGDYDLFGGQFMMLTDLLADDFGGDNELNWTGTFGEPREFWRKEILVNNAFAEDQWVDSYNAINITNNVLSALDVVDASERDRVEGEAKFIRGTLYFELARRFARAYNDGDPSSNLGVPIVLEPTRVIGEDNNVPRSTVEQVYDRAISDLQDAKELLPGDNGFFAHTYAASAMLSRIYLMQGDYAGAAAESDRVIASGDFELMDDFAAAFNSPEDVDEYVFAMQVTSQDGDHSLNTFYGSEGNNGRGDIDITDTHLDLYEEDDARGAFFYVDGDDAVRTSKWANGVDGNIPVVRLAEMYLTRAEANFRRNSGQDGPDPLDDVNTIRSRAGLDDLAAGDLDLDAILLERKLELAFEGHLLHDIKRNEGSVGNLSYDASELVYPIPEREVDANPNMEQNAGYGS